MIHRGTYDGTIYHNPANKFCIISVKTTDKDVPQEARSTRRHKDHLIRFVATGYELPRTDAVELELDGEWKKGKYGMQLQVEQWHEIVPQTTSGVEGYLASGLIKGIGPALAKQIVSRFGVETLDILQNRPERLLEIKGISENKLEDIKTSYAESRMLQDLMTLLSPFKITPKTAQKIYQFFGPASVDILKKSPFELCQISGFGFLRVDAIVQKNGGDLRAPMRIKGALFWALEDSKGKKGHLFLTSEALKKEALHLLNAIRALALALGKTRALQSDNMFVGNQRGSFLQMVRRTSNGDVYLQGALYLLETDMPRRHALLDKLAATEYVKTEEALFVLSLFDDQEEGYRTMHSQLLRLLGKERTLSLPENCGVLEWLVQHYAPYIKSYRGKPDLVLRTLTKFFRMNMKPDSREFSILTDAGYSGEEIILTNSLCVWADRIPDRISWNGTTAEKIASACCQMLLNQPDGLSEGLYAYVGWLFGRYEKFAVQYNGYPNLWEAVKKELIPSAPQTMIWMLKNIKKEFPYRFDAFAPQYDILAKEVPHDDYWELFTDQMLCSCGKTPIAQWLARYRELTGVDYCDGFQEWHRSSDRAFAMLVERKEIRLWQFFEQHQGDGPSAQPMKLLLGYAMNISSWQGFRFVRRLLQKYTPVQLQKFFGERFFFHELFVRGNRYSSRDYELFIKRSFLTEEQQRQLFEWTDSSFFQMEPERYQEFIWCALQNSDVQRLYDRRLLASVLRSLLSSGKYAGRRADHLKEKFYSKEELEADQKADAEKAEREERLRREQEHQKKCERLEQIYNGTMSSLKEFTKSFYYDRDVKEALDMVYEKLREQPAGCAAAFEADELEHFFKLCGDLARYNPGEEQKILNMARTMMGGLAA